MREIVLGFHSQQTSTMQKRGSVREPFFVARLAARDLEGRGARARFLHLRSIIESFPGAAGTRRRKDAAGPAFSLSERKGANWGF